MHILANEDEERQTPKILKNKFVKFKNLYYDIKESVHVESLVRLFS